MTSTSKKSLASLCSNAKQELDFLQLLEKAPVAQDEAKKARIKLFVEIKKLIDHLEDSPSVPATPTVADRR